MSLTRTCYLCGRPVSIRRQMSLFCSERCELRHRQMVRDAAASPPREAPADAGNGAAPSGETWRRAPPRAPSRS